MALTSLRTAIVAVALRRICGAHGRMYVCTCILHAHAVTLVDHAWALSAICIGMSNSSFDERTELLFSRILAVSTRAQHSDGSPHASRGAAVHDCRYSL